MEEDRINPARDEVWAAAEASVLEAIVSALNVGTDRLTNGAFPALNPNAPNAVTT